MELENIRKNEANFFAIQNNKNLQITFCSLGASIYAIKYKSNYVTYHAKSYDEFLHSQKYYGKTLGRVCGRIKDGQLVIDGKTYDLEKNERGNTLHGGNDNLSFTHFNYEISENDEHINVIFKHVSPAGKCGFPGNVNFIIVYSLQKNQDKFSVHYVAKPDATTPINMSSHLYWRLTGKDILDHTLCINAGEVTLTDPKTLIVTGKEKVRNIFDFRTPKKIGQDILAVAKENPAANGYDHGYIFNEGEEHKIVLKNNDITLTIKTDMSMVNIYANCFPTGGMLMQYGQDIVYGGIAIEPQMFYTSYKDLLLKSGETYDHFISYELSDK